MTLSIQVLVDHPSYTLSKRVDDPGYLGPS